MPEVSKILGKIISSYDRFEVNTHLSSELVNEFEYELKIDLKRIKLSKSAINSNFEVLREFIGQLP